MVTISIPCARPSRIAQANGQTQMELAPRELRTKKDVAEMIDDFRNQRVAFPPVEAVFALLYAVVELSEQVERLKAERQEV